MHNSGLGRYPALEIKGIIKNPGQIYNNYLWVTIEMYIR